MEPSELSEHLCRVVAFARTSGQWLTSKELHVGAGVAPRTARAHAATLVRLGLFDVAKVFPGHRYRWSELAQKRNAAIVNRIDAALKVLQ